MKRMKLRVEGVTCAGCATDAESVLKNADGILGAEVSYAAGTITIDYHPSEIDAQQVIGLVKKLGWKIL